MQHRGRCTDHLHQGSHARSAWAHTRSRKPCTCPRPSITACAQGHGQNLAVHEPTRRAVLALLAAMPLAQAPAKAALVEEDRAQAVYQSCKSGVVSVVNYTRDKAGGEVFSGVGAGLVWDEYGHVVTNYHVVSRMDKSANTTKVVVTAPDGSSVTLAARVVGMDSMKDLAVLAVDDANGNAAAQSLLRPMAVGTSANLKIGQSVFALGAPYGLGGTLTAGVVSGLNRSIPSPVGTRIYGCIQTDASINAGNSGGPLVDSAGRVVGINTATFTRQGTGRGSGVNFALPVDVVREVVPQLIIYGNSSGKRV